MKDNTIRFLRTILLMAAMAAGIFVLQGALELLFSGAVPRGFGSLTAADAATLYGLLSGKLNQAMSVIFIVIGMGLPLTANMYSLKFVEFFIRNPINVSVLLFIIIASLSELWASYSLSAAAVPRFQLGLMLVFTAVSLILFLPYLTYVFRFLHPRTLLHLLEKEALACLKAAGKSDDPGECRHRMAENLEHIANISIRSVDRFDRNTAMESVLTLERVARHYWRVKGKLPPAWFEADPNSFLGFSSVTVGEMTSARSWMEMKLYYQFFEILRAACPRMPELTSTIANSLRKLSLEAAALEHPALRDLGIEYFNTFIRLTLNRQDVRSLFIIFDQYRTFAETLEEKFPQEVQEIAYYFTYYGEAARNQHLPFVVETVAHDLGVLVKKAWQRGSPNREELLHRFLEYDRRGSPVFPGVKKAQALLASYFLFSGEAKAADLIARTFRSFDPEFIRGLKEELLQVNRQRYWEISERRMNIEFVPPPQRAKLQEFFEGLAAGPAERS